MENINNRVDEPSGSRCYKEGVRKKFDCYCKRFIRNAAYDVARTATRNLEREKLLPDEEMEEMISDSGFQDEGTAEELYICNKSVLISDPKLAKILKSLSKRKREILMLSVYYGYSAEEIAKTLRISTETVYSTKAKTLKEIRERERCDEG